jgi:hypothetical protein
MIIYFRVVWNIYFVIRCGSFVRRAYGIKPDFSLLS